MMGHGMAGRLAAGMLLALAVPAAAQEAGTGSIPGLSTRTDTGFTGRYDPANPFARMLRGELATVKVYEDDQVLAFMNNRPTSPGHLLVIPKGPYRNLADIDPAMLQHLIAVVQRIARAEVAGLGADGVTIRQNSGWWADQTVYHFHMHVVPRYRNRALTRPTYADPATPPAELEAVAAKIRAALRD